jgi:peptidoglycan hydrolase-like protein with peptidoglycan-binding domain
MSSRKRFLMLGCLGVLLLAGLLLTSTTHTAFAAGCNTVATGNWSNNCQTSEGNISNFVYAIQQAINTSSAGCSTGVDGNFGPSTLAAVKCFQRSRGLTADGIVGPITWGALQAVLRSSTTSGGWHYYTEQVSSTKLFRESTSSSVWDTLVGSTWCEMTANSHC